MKQITCIFFGRSGSGKGTQADLLIKKLSAMDPENRVIYIETGSELRKLKTNGTYTADLIKGVIDNGKLMPASIPILCWSNLMMHEVKTGKEHMVFDGVARRADEAPILSQALEFYGRKDTAVIFLNASNPEVTGRLLKRGRHDDTTDKIAERLKWFETDVMPSVNFFKSQTKCQYIEIDGDQSIEKVHADIVKELGM